MSESVFADDGFVRLNFYTGDTGQHLRRTHNFLCDDSRIRLVQIFSRLHSHGDFFERSIAGAFADSVDSAFQLSSPRFHRGQRICHRQTQVVVAVYGDIHGIQRRAFFSDLCQESEIFLRSGISYGIRNIDRRRARFDHPVEDLRQEIRVASRRVFRGKLDVGHILFRMFYHSFRALQNCLRLHEKLVFHMDRRCGDKGVNSRRNRFFYRFIRSIDIRRKRPGQTRHRTVFESLRNRFYGEEISRRRSREAGFDDIHIETFQLLRHLDFFFQVHAAARGLLAVTKSRVKNFNLFHLFSSCRSA